MNVLLLPFNHNRWYNDFIYNWKIIQFNTNILINQSNDFNQITFQ